MGLEEWKRQVSAEVPWYVLAGVSVRVQPLCMILWAQIPEWVDSSFLEVHKIALPSASSI